MVAPGADDVARVVFRPPRSTHVSSGPAPFTVKLVSAVDDVGAVSVDGVVDVAGFTTVSARLVPPIVEGRHRATQELVLENEGTAPARVSIDVRPGAGEPDVAVDPATADLAPRDSQQATVTVRARRVLLGRRSRHHRFQLAVTTETAGGAPQPPALVDGTLRQQPVRGVVPVVVALLVALGGGLSTLGDGGTSGRQTGDGERSMVAPDGPPACPPPAMR